MEATVAAGGIVSHIHKALGRKVNRSLSKGCWDFSLPQDPKYSDSCPVLVIPVDYLCEKHNLAFL